MNPTHGLHGKELRYILALSAQHRSDLSALQFHHSNLGEEFMRLLELERHDWRWRQFPKIRDLQAHQTSAIERFLAEIEQELDDLEAVQEEQLRKYVAEYRDCQARGVKGELMPLREMEYTSPVRVRREFYMRDRPNRADRPNPERSLKSMRLAGETESVIDEYYRRLYFRPHDEDLAEDVKEALSLRRKDGEGESKNGVDSGGGDDMESDEEDGGVKLEME
ncbi:hypothetical protein PRZ48_009915 [Zasmidium cellare]|uniref:Uncharacterized protein n=1 Tax=Zasmidium cellare TaxID=395010 RepID=A0ABR0EDR8_ZASCE|nr:hypothetical protein PRZ48_009915 [Zasmidium cellare]